MDGWVTSDSSLTLLLTYEMQLPLERWVLLKSIYHPVGCVFHFYCWSRSNVPGEEIVKLKLDWSYLATPAESWQPGKAAVRLLPFSRKE